MTREEIKNELIVLCTGIFQNAIADTSVIEYVDFIDDLGMDSITFVALIVEIEAKFDITVPDDLLSMEHFNNINDVISLIIQVQSI